MKSLAASLLLFLSIPLISAQAAKPTALKKETPASVSLISELSKAAPGASFQLALDFKIQKGWHIYWQNAGDYGEPPQVKWAPIDGAEFGSFLWPVPRKIQVGQIVSFGYEDEIILPVPVTLSKSISGPELKLTANVRWLVCKEVCIPGKTTLELNLPLQTTPEVNPETKARLQAIQKNLPTEAPRTFVASGKLTENDFTLKIDHLPDHSETPTLFPAQSGLIEYSAPSEVKNTKNQVEWKLKRSDRLVDSVSHFPALLFLTDANGESHSYQVDIPVDDGNPAKNSSFLIPLFFAFLGGLLLNLMPCVFPVLSIKAMSLVKLSRQDLGETKKMGWAYTFGILVSFWILVGTLLFLRLSGQQIGWGFQLQSPRFVFILTCILFTFGLNLLGLFEISGGKLTGVGSGLANRDGLIGSFFTGVLATLVATPCTAPFMGSAIGFAFSQPPLIIFLIFTALAFGLALPYLAICYLPHLSRILPKPGPWMETFKHLMAFLIFGTAIWLASVLSFQTNPFGLILLLGAFLGIGFATWIAHHWPKKSKLAFLIGFIITSTAVYFVKPASASLAVDQTSGTGNPDELKWQKFSPEKVSELQKSQPVFVDFTAAWCVSCQVNELVVFHSEDVKKKLKEKKVALLKGDWTNQDPVITQTLKKFGREGVPFYVLYPQGENAPAVPFPEVINAGLVLNELEKLK